MYPKLVDPNANGINGDHGYGYSKDELPAPSRLERFFLIRQRNTTVWTEIRAGLVTFATMAYILLINPTVLSLAGTDSTGGPFPFGPLVSATAISAALASITVGLWANVPFGLAPGMGLNSYFTYGACLHMGLSWQTALTAVFFQGILFTLISMIGLCSWIQRYTPACIKKSLTVGLGIFQALIGFESMRLVVRGEQVLLALGDLHDLRLWLALLGIIVIALLLILEVRAAMLIGIGFVTMVCWVCGLSPAPSSWIMLPTFKGTFWQFDFDSYFEFANVTIPLTLVFLFVSIFDTTGVQFAAGRQAGLLDDEDHLPHATRAFVTAGVSTTIGSMFGTSPVIIVNETCAGIHDGGRTGLTAVTVGICFLLALPFSPLFSAVPAVASAPPLVIVGVLMMACAKFIDWEQLDEAVPAFIVMTLVPFTYSIANGMIFGLLTYTLIKGGCWAIGRILGRHVTSLPLMSEDPSEGLLDPVPGVPQTPFVYHASDNDESFHSDGGTGGRSGSITSGGDASEPHPHTNAGVLRTRAAKAAAAAAAAAQKPTNGNGMYPAL